MSQNTRQCPFTGCKVMLPPERFACGPHWSAVPAELKRRAWSLYEQWQAGKLSPEELRAGQAEVVRITEVKQKGEPAPAGPAVRGTRPGVCSGCGAKILWAVTVKGKDIPLDAAPDPKGNIHLVPAGAMVLTRDALERARANGDAIWMPHHATCPHAARFRKK